MPLKVGIVGCGRITAAHLRGYLELKNNGLLGDVIITAMCDQIKSYAESWLKRGVGPSPIKEVGPPGDPMATPRTFLSDFQPDVEVGVYTDYREMLKKADVDAVEILTPVFAHHSIAVDAINAGKHVLVEKPFSVSVKAGWRILEAAEKQGVVLGIADALHYREDARMTKWAIDQGYIGRPQVYIYARGAGYWDPDKIVAETPWRHIKIYAGAGITADWLAHRSHLLNLYYRKISEVSAHVDILSPRRKTVDETGKVVKEVDCNVDDTVLAILKHESGTLGFLFASWSLHGVTLNEDRVYGSKGCLVGDKLVSEGKGEVSLRELFNREAKQSLKEKFFPKGITNHFALEILEFLSAIKEKREMETSGKDGLREVAVAYAMIESSRRGRAVYVDDVLNGKICDYEMEINRYYEI